MFLSLNAALQKLKSKSENMSVGVFTSPPMLENVTHGIFAHGFGSMGPGSGGVLEGGGVSPGGHRPAGKHCYDLHRQLVTHGVQFVPGPDKCESCTCDDGEAKWCKALSCAPPQVKHYNSIFYNCFNNLVF